MQAMLAQEIMKKLRNIYNNVSSGLLEEDDKEDGEACCSAQGDVDLECSVMEDHSLYLFLDKIVDV